MEMTDILTALFPNSARAYESAKSMRQKNEWDVKDRQEAEDFKQASYAYDRMKNYAMVMDKRKFAGALKDLYKQYPDGGKYDVEENPEGLFIKHTNAAGVETREPITHQFMKEQLTDGETFINSFNPLREKARATVDEQNKLNRANPKMTKGGNWAWQETDPVTGDISWLTKDDSGQVRKTDRPTFFEDLKPEQEYRGKEKDIEKKTAEIATEKERPAQVRAETYAANQAGNYSKAAAEHAGDFSLGPNEVRYDRSGKVVARGEQATDVDVEKVNNHVKAVLGNLGLDAKPGTYKGESVFTPYTAKEVKAKVDAAAKQGVRLMFMDDTPDEKDITKKRYVFSGGSYDKSVANPPANPKSRVPSNARSVFLDENNNEVGYRDAEGKEIFFNGKPSAPKDKPPATPQKQPSAPVDDTMDSLGRPVQPSRLSDRKVSSLAFALIDPTTKDPNATRKYYLEKYGKTEMERIEAEAKRMQKDKGKPTLEWRSTTGDRYIDLGWNPRRS